MPRLTTAGHLGIRKTHRRIAQRYFWPGLHRDVVRYATSCLTCQQYKVILRKPAGKMLTRQHTEPFALVGADFVGNVPQTRRGNTMLLVFIDIFFKWPKLPGVLPEQRYSTQARQPYYQDHRTWDQLLPEISLAINTSISDSTGFIPAYLVQGREPRLPGALFDAVAPDLHASPLDPTEQAKRLQEAFRTALETNQIASQEQRQHYNLRRREWRPQISSEVLVRLHHLSKASEGFNAKLAPKYAGPFKVVKFLSSNVVRLQQVDGRKRGTAGIGDLKEYHRREEQHDDSTEGPRRSDSHPTLDDVLDTTLSGWSDNHIQQMDMEPDDPYQVEGVYRPVDHREGSVTGSSGESQGHDSV
ncbi:uncharacterized protein LOC128264247 [Drosophila gunungcola]|uniref:uncharacterized protein LOC128264247 n=1 Tax=Drosophila gunungcola TaxID=103775 RepID=UPI0022E6A01C|nr:uncharacterized protein LOC128264247 [Drosophila gunungcola]